MPAESTETNDQVLSVQWRASTPSPATPDLYDDYPWMQALDEQIQRMVDERIA